ncbi:hypothetical protein BDV41DRAFT_122612 [Aspergillus transmontanensis]|uniref:Uncharacterized protein n=1 Tax=Aspergillus transmontanensis TaxID=1034304 RepID=A0A5N6W6N2_9EURO|nr:hypothetical protein BDV41DRAFT_122612 [Aspergillus transmontanensis]
MTYFYLITLFSSIVFWFLIRLGLQSRFEPEIPLAAGRSLGNPKPLQVTGEIGLGFLLLLETEDSRLARVYVQSTRSIELGSWVFKALDCAAFQRFGGFTPHHHRPSSGFLRFLNYPMTGTDAIRDVLFLVGSQTQRTFRRLVFLNPRTHEWFYFPYIREHGEVIWDRIGQVIGQRCPVWFFGFFF